MSRRSGDLRVHGPGVLDAGGPFVAPHAADDLGGGFHDPARSGQFADGLGVGGAQQPQAAIGGGGDPVPLILIAPSPCQDCAETCTPMPSDRPRSYSCHSGTLPDTAE